MIEVVAKYDLLKEVIAICDNPETNRQSPHLSAAI